VSLSVGEFPNGERVGVLGGVETCGNALFCPHCTPKVQAERADNVATVLRKHLAGGGGALFLSLTASHAFTDSLESSLEAVMASWRSLTGHRRWKGANGLKKRWQVTGFIKVLEITYGRNGWHPHLHVVVLTSQPVIPAPDPDAEEGEWQHVAEEVAEIRDELTDLWGCLVATHGREIVDGVGVDVQPIRDESGIGAYVSKVAMEATRSDLKTGKRDSRSHWQIGLDAAAGDTKSMALWRELVETLYGRRTMSTSAGLWARYGINVRTDDEIAEDQGDNLTQVALIDADLIRKANHVGAHVINELKDLATQGASPELLATVLGRRIGEAVEVGLGAAGEDGVQFQVLRRVRSSGMQGEGIVDGGHELGGVGWCVGLLDSDWKD
jgi:hypothetical protein